MIRNTARQLDCAGIGEYADVDFRQCEARMLFHDDDVGAEHELEAAAAGDAVDRRNDRLVQVARIIEAAEAPDTPILIGFFAGGRGFKIPSRGKKLLSGPRKDRDTQRGVIAERREYVVETAARRQIDRVGLGPIDPHFEYRTVFGGQYSMGHGLISP